MARDPQDDVAAALLTQWLDHVRVHAVADLPLAAAQQRYPVVILEPGLGPLLTDYTVLAEDLASHGYVVIGSTPTYSASVVVFADGHVTQSTAAGNVPDAASLAETQQILGRLITVWVGDVTFLLDQAATLNRADASHRFTDRLDLQHIGVMDHSFGGATAAEVCASDVRCTAGIDLDGYLYGDVVQRGLTRPFMFVWSEPPDPSDAGWQLNSRESQAIYSTLPHGSYQLMIKGARHFNFSDYAVLYAPVVKLSDGLGSIDGRRGLLITTTMSTPSLTSISSSNPPTCSTVHRQTFPKSTSMYARPTSPMKRVQ